MNKPKKPSAVDKFLALSDAQKSKAVAEFDREFVADTFGPPPARAKAKLRKSQQVRGRPRVGQGAERVLVTIERGLLARADKTAKALKVSRSKLIAAGLQSVLARRSA
jgi:hypothetical protein